MSSSASARCGTFDGIVRISPALHRHVLLAVLAEPEAQRALEDVRDLLALVRVRLHDRALLQEHLRDHRALAVDETALDLRGHALLRDAVPGVMRAQLHGCPPYERGDSTRGVPLGYD